MSSTRSELAAAARRVAALARRVPSFEHPNLAAEWNRLLEQVEDEPLWKAKPQIREFTDRIERAIWEAAE